MKIRTTLDLSESLDTALAWRRRELHAVVASAQACRDSFKEPTCRAAYLIIYAHWEGFVKEAATAYLQFVSRQRVPYKDLKTNFVAIASYNSIRQAASSGKNFLYSQVVDFLFHNSAERSRIPFAGVIDTESNLKSEVLENIVFTIGLDSDCSFKTKHVFIDRELLKRRNRIAHGEREPVTFSELSEAKNQVDSMLVEFKTHLENFAVAKAYLR